MAQTRVSEFFPSKKKSRHSNATKRRIVELTTTEEDISSLKQRGNRNIQVQSEQPLVAEAAEAKATKSQTKAKSVKLSSSARSKSRTQRQSSKNVKNEENNESQPKISDIFSAQINEYKNSSQPLSFNFSENEPSEAVPSAWDEHDGPDSTPTKQLRLSSQAVSCRSRKEVQNTKDNDQTPQKEMQEVVKSAAPRSVRKKLQMNQEQNVSNESPVSDGLTIDKIVDSMKLPEKVISPIPVTPENMKTPTKSKGPSIPTSPNVKAAIEKCKKLLKNGDNKAKEKQIKEEIKARLKKCGKLEELKSQLSEMNKVKKQLKTPVPKLNKFDNIEIEIEQPIISQSPVKSSPFKSEPKAPAYERYHSLATPAPPTLTLPYKYKLLLEMFRGMDTVVSMMHNRSEVCTFSKLKVAVQTMTKRNFEKKNVGQIKTVYPSAYHFRQERVPCYGKKMSDYQLSVEVDLDPDIDTDKNSMKGKLTFSAKHLLQRRQNFHTGLISIVKQHHQPPTQTWAVHPDSFVKDPSTFALLSSCLSKLRKCLLVAQGRRILYRFETSTEENAYKSPKEDVYSIDLKPLQDFLGNLDRPLHIPESKLSRWHPRFPLDEVPDVVAAALPEAPNVHTYQSARDVLEHTRGKLIPKVEQALEDVAKNSALSVKTEVKQERNSPTPSAAMKGVPMSLLEKIRAKEAKKLEAALTRNPAEDKKKAMISRLPDMIRIIRSYFVTEKKPSIQFETMVQKLADSYRTGIAIGDVEGHVKLLLELAPEWLTMVQIKKGRYLKIDRNIDIQALSGKIKNQAKSQ